MISQIRFAENLRSLRLGRNMTQEQLAKLLGVDKRTVSAWENRVCEPGFSMLAKICDCFDETFDEILS